MGPFVYSDLYSNGVSPPVRWRPFRSAPGRLRFGVTSLRQAAFGRKRPLLSAPVRPRLDPS
jgi:hypothetical protein